MNVESYAHCEMCFDFVQYVISTIGTIHITASVFETGAMATPIKLQTQPFWFKGFRSFQLVPNGHTLAGFAIGNVCLVTMTALHLRALHKTKSCFLISC
jgi:hypothetical protein